MSHVPLPPSPSSDPLVLLSGDDRLSLETPSEPPLPENDPSIPSPSTPHLPDLILNQDGSDDSPPEYDGDRRLIPILPIKNSRYDINRSAVVHHRPIPPGPLDRSYNDRPTPPGWHKMVHPEGQLYFYSPNSRIVSEAFLHNRMSLARANFWGERVQQLAIAASIELPPSSELFLEFDDATDCCRYYFVDHATRGVFWLDGGTTDQLDLPEVSSDDHLRMVLEEQYWNHVEFFPNHIKLAPNVEFELRAMLTHTAIDAFTSDASTAPYTMQQSQDFLNLINNLPTTPESNSHKNCIIARLMAEFASNKFVNHSGEQSARLSRLTNLRGRPQIHESRIIRILCFLCFNLPPEHEKQLEELWVDEIAFSAHWRKFMQQRTSDWREQAIWGFALAILNALLLLAPFGSDDASRAANFATDISRAATLTAEFFSMGSAITAVMLLGRHQVHTDAHALDASLYLEKVRHESFGFRPLAIVYSVPAAFLQWSSMFMILVAFTLPARLHGMLWIGLVLIVVAIIVSVVLAMQKFFGESDSESMVSSSCLKSACWFLPWLKVRPSDYSEIRGEV